MLTFAILMILRLAKKPSLSCILKAKSKSFVFLPTNDLMFNKDVIDGPMYLYTFPVLT